MTLLAPEITFTADSGGKALAARHPVVGANRVARYVAELFGKASRTPDLRLKVVNCNNAPAIAAYSADRLEGVYLLDIRDGRIADFYAIRNPDKLAALEFPRRIMR